MEDGVIQQQRRVSPAGKGRFREVFPEDEHRLMLQKFAAAIFQARIVSVITGGRPTLVGTQDCNDSEFTIHWLLWKQHKNFILWQSKEKEPDTSFHPNVCPVSEQGMLSLYGSLLALTLLGMMGKSHSRSQLSFGNEKALEIAEIEY